MIPNKLSIRLRSSSATMTLGQSSSPVFVLWHENTGLISLHDVAASNKSNPQSHCHQVDAISAVPCVLNEMSRLEWPQARCGP